MDEKNISDTGNILREIRTIVKKARYNAFNAVNKEMLKCYFDIGRKIVEEEQKGKARAGYGQRLMQMLSEELTREFKKGFGVTSLKNMRNFYLVYKKNISQSVTGEFNLPLTWTHYCELIKIKNETKRLYFEKCAQKENLSVRDLKQQIYSQHYERLLMSKNKKAIAFSQAKDFVPVKVEDMIKDPYVLEFLDLDKKHQYNEKEMEANILDDLQKFLLELEQGFSFVARQKRFTIDNEHFYIDLLFYNIYLKCYVVIELKVGKFKHENIGQMNFYLTYVRKELNKKDDNSPVGILLCSEKNNIEVEYATDGISSKLFASKYKLYLPTKEELENEVRKLI